MQQAVRGQDGGICEPPDRVPILVAAGHGVEKAGITGGYPDIRVVTDPAAFTVGTTGAPSSRLVSPCGVRGYVVGFPAVDHRTREFATSALHLLISC